MPYQGRAVTVAALEFSLDEGWKTYWRTPGDGLPTSVDWSGSENLKKADILWPAPKRLNGPLGSVSYVYEDRVILPILITRQDEARPALLRLDVNYGICADICIPAEASFQFAPPTTADNRHREAILDALRRVPRRQGRGVNCAHRVMKAKRQTIDKKPVLLVSTAIEKGATGLDLFAEAPEGFDTPIPVKQPRASGESQDYIIGFDDPAELEELENQELIFTAVSDQGSCEIAFRME